MKSGSETVISASGRELEVSWAFETPGNVRVDLIDVRKPKRVETRKTPSRFFGNFGGAEIVASPKGTYVALWMHSGQSEQGYLLLRLEPFEQLASPTFTFGMGAAPVFSPDETYVVMENAQGFADYRDESRREIAYSEVLVQTLRDPATWTSHEVIVTSTAWTKHPSDWPGIVRLRFATDSGLVLVLPWGAEASVQLPLGEHAHIAIAGPTKPLRR